VKVVNSRWSFIGCGSIIDALDVTMGRDLLAAGTLSSSRHPGFVVLLRRVGRFPVFLGDCIFSDTFSHITGRLKRIGKEKKKKAAGPKAVSLRRVRLKNLGLRLLIV
jgi:hypothetical protein